jgi:3',5'-cyclic AMP phosphodiesterase CpdA
LRYFEEEKKEMNILHLSDLHFGPRHWDGDDEVLLEKINSYPADVVIDTGDTTTDGREREYAEARRFLDKIDCEYFVAVIGNHDKRNTVGHELFKEYVFNPQVLYPSSHRQTQKQKLFVDRKITKLKEDFTDVNFLELLTIDGKRVLFIGIDNTLVFNDNGFVEESILNTIEEKLHGMTYDLPLLLTHYPLLGTDMDLFMNSRRLIDFVNSQKIEFVFCGHDHLLRLEKSCDLYAKHRFYHFMCGTTGAANTRGDDNVFLFYENVGDDNFHLYLIRMLHKDGRLEFKEEKIR